MRMSLARVGAVGALALVLLLFSALALVGRGARPAAP